MREVMEWLEKHHEEAIRGLADLVAIQSISTDGEHAQQIERTANFTCQLMREAGLNNVEVLRVADSMPYAYGEYIVGPDKPTVFLYAHHDVQPVNYVEQWKSDPWKLTRRDGRLYGRGAADDKGAITAQCGAVAAFLKARGTLPVNVKMLVEGEEEVGSKNLMKFFDLYKKKLMSDVIVVCDTENIEVGLPSITYSLRGIVGMQVDVHSANLPIHSGMGGGAIPDSAIALNHILARLFWNHGPLPVPGMYERVRRLTEKEKQAFRELPFDEPKMRKEIGIVPTAKLPLEPNSTFYEATWRKPAVTVIAQEASNLKGASNQVLPSASAIVSCRIVPDQDEAEVYKCLVDCLTADPPWGVKVDCKPAGSVKWWMTDPNGPAFEAALTAMQTGFDKKPVAIGCGGSIGFVGPLSELFGGAPALLMGIEDPASNAHAPNESLHEGDLKKLMASMCHLFENLGKLAPGKVK